MGLEELKYKGTIGRTADKVQIPMGGVAGHAEILLIVVHLNFCHQVFSYNISIRTFSYTTRTFDPSQSEPTHNMANTVDKTVLEQVQIALQNADVELQDINKKVCSWTTAS